MLPRGEDDEDAKLEGWKNEESNREKLRKASQL
jgi:hypothetical protein